MFVLIMNSGNGEQLWSTLEGVFETHKEAHDEMVSLMERHREDWCCEYNCDADAFTVEVEENQGHLMDGDVFDWRYYEKHLIFDSDNPNTICY